MGEKRVLIIDDALPVRKLVGMICKHLGFTETVEAFDGMKGWDILTESPKPFDLIVSDWNMPHSSGLDLLRRVRKDPRFEKLPFIMVTAESETRFVGEAFKEGASEYIVKPVSMEKVKDKIAKLGLL